MNEYMLLMAIASVISQQFTNQQNKQQTEAMLEYQERQTNNAQEYNSLPAQMARARAAGVNPVSVAMGNGSVNSTGVQPQAGISPAIMQNPLSILPGLMQGLLHGEQAETESITRDAQLNLLNKQADQLVATCQQIGLSNEQMEIVLKYQDSIQQLTVEGLKYQNDLTFAEKERVYEEIKKITYEVTELLPAQLQKLIAEKNLDVMNLGKVVQEIQNMKLTANEIQSHTNLLDSQKDAQEIENEIKRQLISDYVDQYRALTKQIQSQTGLTDMELAYFIPKNLDKFARPWYQGSAEKDLNYKTKIRLMSNEELQEELKKLKGGTFWNPEPNLGGSQWRRIQAILDELEKRNS